MQTTELTPNLARKIIADASNQGVPVEAYLKNIIANDERLALMREAVDDELFMADLDEVTEDFKHVDLE